MERSGLSGILLRVIARLLVSGCLACGLALQAGADRARLVADGLPAELEALIAGALPEEASPATALEARRQARRAASRVQETLSSAGYLDPRVDFAVEDAEGFVPVVRVEPGQRFTVGHVEISYRGARPHEAAEEAVANAIGLRTGTPAEASRVLSPRSAITNVLRQAGYAFAEAEAPEVIGDRDTATIDVSFPVSAGPRIRFGQVIVEGAERTKDKFIDKISPLEAGDIYDPGVLSEFNGRLAGTRLFSLASAKLSTTATSPNEDGTETRDVIVTLDERARHTVTLGGTWSTAEGAGVTGSWTRRNLTGRGDSLIVTAGIAQLERSLDATWRRPAEFGYGRNVSVNLGVSDETTDAYDRSAILLGANLELNRNPRLTFNFGGNVEIAREQDVLGERDIQIVRGLAAARIDQSNDPINATKGWRAQVSLIPAQTFGSESTAYLRSLNEISAYLPFGPKDRVVLAGRLRAGGVIGSDSLDIPVRDRFYAGGGGSIRGFGYQEVGPVDVDTNTPVGGRYLLESAAEVRVRVRDKLSVVGFLDGGNVGQDELPDWGELRLGAGMGVRYDTVAGPIRFDIATPLDRRSGEDAVQIYISIGQAF